MTADDFEIPPTKGLAGEKSSDVIGVWEIWDKRSRQVIFVREDKQRFVRILADPMSLPGFFPMPAPVQPVSVTGKRIPVCPYSSYRQLAEELEEISRRIRAITDGLRVKGWVSGAADDVTSLAEADDNELVPIRGFESVAALGGIDKAIVWWPVDKAIVVVRELYAAREQVKQAIYEITGISDIVRGATAASETATAQSIKEKWGGLRVRTAQRDIERLVRDLFVISADLIARLFAPQSIQAKSGVQLTEQHIMLMRSDLYAIDVESNSTVKAEMQHQKGEAQEFLAGTAQFFQVFAPIIAQQPQLAKPVIGLYSSFARRLNMGRSGEDALDELIATAEQMAQQPPPQQQDPAAADAAMKAQVEQMRMQLEQVKLQQDMQLRQAELQQAGQIAMAQLQQKAMNDQADQAMGRAQLAADVRDDAAKNALAARKLQIDAARPAPAKGPN